MENARMVPQPGSQQKNRPLCTLPRIRSLSWMLPLVLGSLCLSPSLAQSERAITITADSQEANSITGVITAEGNVTIRYAAQQVVANAQKAIYYTQEQRIELEGNVEITQDQNRLQAEQVVYRVDQGTIQAIPTQGQQVESVYILPAAASPAPDSSATP